MARNFPLAISLWIPQIIVSLAVIARVISDCQVLVHEPLPSPFLFVPRGSVVELKCTATDASQLLFWTIDLANDSTTSRLQFNGQQEVILNTHGVYKLQKDGMSPTLIRLLINDTTRNNQTVIKCSLIEVSTTILVFEPTPLTLDSLDIDVETTNLTWSQKQTSVYVADALLNYTLTISHGSNSQVISLNESYYNFTAPEGAPPCEVYNFSVTATYVGATYTGAGCSVPGALNDKMLPSLPDIERLESSLVYHTLSQQSGEFALYVLFEPASDCWQYPISNYTLVIKRKHPKTALQSLVLIPNENFTFENFSENSAYSFRILVSNTVGVVSSKERLFYTTDVQNATVTPAEGVNKTTIQCDFITGSNATGCRVVLNSENGRKAYNMTRDSSTNVGSLTITLEQPLSCYNGVEALDIESDGSVGSLAIPGQIINPSQAPCSPSVVSPVKPSPSDLVLAPWQIVVIAVSLLVLAVVFLIVIVVIIRTIIVCKSEKSGAVLPKYRCPCPCVSQRTHDSHSGDHTIHGQQYPMHDTSLEQTPDRNQKKDHRYIEQHLRHRTESDPQATETSTGAEGGNENTGYSEAGGTVTGLKQESYYSEIASISRKDTARDSGKSKNTYSDLTSPRQPAAIGGMSSGMVAGHGRQKVTGISQEETLYDQPVPAVVRTPGDGADYSRTCHRKQTSSRVNGVLTDTGSTESGHYSTLDQTKDHIYHVLECDHDRGITIAYPGPTSPEIPPPPSKPGPQAPSAPIVASSPPPPTSLPPVYQEITELPTHTRRGMSTRSHMESGTVSIPNTPLSSSSLPIVQRSFSVPFTNDGITEIPGTSNQSVNGNINGTVNIGTMV